jgi:hypothetical protein
MKWLRAGTHSQIFGGDLAAAGQVASKPMADAKNEGELLFSCVMGRKGTGRWAFALYL